MGVRMGNVAGSGARYAKGAVAAAMVVVGAALIAGQATPFSAFTTDASGQQPVHASATTSPCVGNAACPIKHIVVIIKENHSFDNLFARFPGADGTSFARVGSRRVKLGITPDALNFDIAHSGPAADRAVNAGRMNQFYKLSGAIQFGQDYADSAYTKAEIPLYWDYAKTFTLADHFF